MKTIYVVILYSGIECHTEFHKNVGAFETREKADTFVIEESVKLNHQVELVVQYETHMDMWGETNPCPDVDDAQKEYNDRWNAESSRVANEIGLNLDEYGNLGKHIVLEVTEVLFYDGQ